MPTCFLKYTQWGKCYTQWVPSWMPNTCLVHFWNDQCLDGADDDITTGRRQGVQCQGILIWGFGVFSSAEAIEKSRVIYPWYSLHFLTMGYDGKEPFDPLICFWNGCPVIDYWCTYINSLRPRQNGLHFTDDNFKCIFLNENVWHLINVSLKFVPKGPINNILALVRMMAWRLTRPQWLECIIQQRMYFEAHQHYEYMDKVTNTYIIYILFFVCFDLLSNLVNVVLCLIEISISTPKNCQKMLGWRVNRIARFLPKW